MSGKKVGMGFWKEGHSLWVMEKQAVHSWWLGTGRKPPSFSKYMQGRLITRCDSMVAWVSKMNGCLLILTGSRRCIDWFATSIIVMHVVYGQVHIRCASGLIS